MRASRTHNRLDTCPAVYQPVHHQFAFCIEFQPDTTAAKARIEARSESGPYFLAAATRPDQEDVRTQLLRYIRNNGHKRFERLVLS